MYMYNEYSNNDVVFCALPLPGQVLGHSTLKLCNNLLQRDCIFLQGSHKEASAECISFYEGLGSMSCPLLPKKIEMQNL